MGQSSHYQPRERAFSAADFRGVRLYEDDEFTLFPRQDQGVLSHVYAGQSRIAPADLKAVFAEGAPGRHIFRIGLTDPAQTGMSACKISVTSVPKGAFFAAATFHFSPHRMVGDSDITIERGQRGKGIGTWAMRSIMECAMALGFDRFPFHAGLSNGAYSWARMGAVQHRSDPDLSPRLFARLEAVSTYLQKPDYETLRGLCRLEDAGDLSRMAALNHIRLTTATGGNLLDRKDNPHAARMAQYYLSRAPDLLNKYQPFFELMDLKNAFDEAAEQERADIPAARVLLASVGWDAVVDFGDRAQMEKIGAYLGGWKTSSWREPVAARALALA